MATFRCSIRSRLEEWNRFEFDDPSGARAGVPFSFTVPVTHTFVSDNDNRDNVDDYDAMEILKIFVEVSDVLLKWWIFNGS